MRPNAMTFSDEAGFWEQAIGKMRPLGYQSPYEPPAAPVREPGPEDVADMDMQAYARFRADHGIDTGEFIGIRPWKRPTNNQIER